MCVCSFVCGGAGLVILVFSSSFFLYTFPALLNSAIARPEWSDTEASFAPWQSDEGKQFAKHSQRDIQIQISCQTHTHAARVRLTQLVPAQSQEQPPWGKSVWRVGQCWRLCTTSEYVCIEVFVFVCVWM